jgi:AcrR family transcriptional regulator
MTTEAEGRAARRRARTRASLLAAARQVYAAKGYHAATVADITSAADVGVGTFYLHFKDKDDALATLLREGLVALQERIEATVAHLPPEQTIPATIRAIFNYAYEQRDLFRIALTGGGQRELAMRAQAGLAGYFTAALEHAQARGELRGADGRLLARLLTGMVSQGIVWWFEHDEPAPEAMTEQVLGLLRYGLPASLLAPDSRRLQP